MAKHTIKTANTAFISVGFYFSYYQRIHTERNMKNQAFLQSCNLAPPFPTLSRQQVISLSQSSYVSPVQLTDGTGGRGRARSQIICPRASLVLCKTFKTLCVLFSFETIGCVCPWLAPVIKRPVHSTRGDVTYVKYFFLLIFFIKKLVSVHEKFKPFEGDKRLCRRQVDRKKDFPIIIVCPCVCIN